MDLSVQAEVRKLEKTTKTFKKHTDPVWEEGFMFLVPNPEDDYVVFKVINEKEDECIGELIYSISALLGENDMRIEKQDFKLSRCETEGTINLSMTLRILRNTFFKGLEDRQSHEEASLTKSEKSEDVSEHSSLSRSSSVSSGSSDNTSIRSDVQSPAQIKLTLRYSVQRQRLIVVVHHVEDLHYDETKGLYVKLYLLPERHKETKRKTQVIRTSKNPVFDETFEFVISQDELADKHLEVSLCEERVIKNEPLEKVVIDLEKLSLVLPYTRLFRLFKKSHDS